MTFEGRFKIRRPFFRNPGHCILESYETGTNVKEQSLVFDACACHANNRQTSAAFAQVTTTHLLENYHIELKCNQQYVTFDRGHCAGTTPPDAEKKTTALFQKAVLAMSSNTPLSRPQSKLCSQPIQSALSPPIAS